MYISEQRLLKWALYSNVIFIFLYFLFKPDGLSLEKVLISSFLFFSEIGIGYLCVRNLSLLSGASNNAKFLFILIMFWGTFVVVRSFTFSIQDWVTNFGNVYMAMAWLMPAMMILGLKIENWKIVFRAIAFMFGLMILAFALLPVFELNDEWIWLLRPINFVLLIGVYRYSPVNRLKIYAIIAVYIIISILGARRAEFLYLALTFGILFIDKLSAIGLRKALVQYIILVFVLLLIVIFTIGYESVSNLVSSLVEFQDSRTFLFKELMEDLSFKEKIIGKGSLGTYYSEFMEHTKWYTVEILKENWWGDSSTRITIEVGYLQMILKGGFVMFVLNVTLFIYSSYMGIFNSNNRFTKNLGYFILILTIMCLIEFRQNFTPIFFLLWMAIGTVAKKSYREMNDEQIEELINIR